MIDVFDRLPKIALCGRPKSGKTTVQQMLTAQFGIRPVDDGRYIRDIAIRTLGLTEWHVTTQEGKDSYVEVCGEKWQVRKILGEIGLLFEQHFGEDFTPSVAWRDAQTIACDPAGTFHMGFCFSSVRRNQGYFYRRNGGIVVEIWNPRVEESPYDFDQYNADAVQYRLVNDGTLDDLRHKVFELFHCELKMPVISA